MKKIKPEKIISALSFTLFVLCLTDAYFKHKEDIDESITRLKGLLANEENSKGEIQDAE